MPEILTVTELGALLKMSKSQIYELCRDRVRSQMAHPLPMLKVNGNLRFDKTAVSEWIKQLQQEAR